MKKFSSLIFALIFILPILAQNTIELANFENIKVSYTLTKLEATDKKDKYLIQVVMVNNNAKPVYYAVQGSENEDKTVTENPFASSFTRVKIRNSTGLFGDGISLNGDGTGLISTSNQFIKVIQPGKFYNTETTFKVKAGEVPIVTNTVNYSLSKISDYDLKINREMIDGLWQSTCSSVDMNFAFVERTSTSPAYILQSVNGKQIKWIKQTETTFMRETDNSTTLSYQKVTNSFLYSSVDGMSCNFTKKQ